MLLNGQERANAPKSAVAAARGLGEHGISRERVTRFLGSVTPTIRRASLLTGRLLARVRPEELDATDFGYTCFVPDTQARAL